MARDPSDELMNMRVIYGSPPEFKPNLDPLGPCVHCGQLASKHGAIGKGKIGGWCPDGNGGWGYDEFEVKLDPKTAESIENLRKELEVKQREVVVVDAPPPHASSDEFSAIRCLEILVEVEPTVAKSVFDALAKLDDVARARVLRYALSRWSG